MYKRGRNEKTLFVQNAQGKTRKNFFIFSLKIVHFGVDFGFQSMLQCERREGKPLEQKNKGKEHEIMTTIITNAELARKLNRINKLSNDMDSMKHELDGLKAEVMDYMTSNGLARLESGGKIATLVESVRTTVDTKALKERYADIAAECSKSSIVKYIRVK